MAVIFVLLTFYCVNSDSCKYEILMHIGQMVFDQKTQNPIIILSVVCSLRYVSILKGATTLSITTLSI